MCSPEWNGKEKRRNRDNRQHGGEETDCLGRAEWGILEFYMKCNFVPQRDLKWGSEKRVRAQLHHLRFPDIIFPRVIPTIPGSHFRTVQFWKSSIRLKSDLRSIQTPRSKAGSIIVIFSFSLAASQFQDKLTESQWDFFVCVDCIVLFSSGIGNLSLPARRCRGLLHMLFVTFVRVGKMDYCRETRAVETWEQVTEPGLLCTALSVCATKAPHYCGSLTLHCAHKPLDRKETDCGMWDLEATSKANWCPLNPLRRP